MKTFMVALSVVALLFAQMPVAHAVSFEGVKQFLIGGGDDEHEEENENSEVNTNLLGASALQALTADTEITITPVAEEEPEVSDNRAIFVFNIERGDTLWDRIEAELEVAFPDMTLEQENFVIDSIIDEMRALSGNELGDMGVSSENVDLIYPDEVISFSVDISGEDLEDIQVEQQTSR